MLDTNKDIFKQIPTIRMQLHHNRTFAKAIAIHHKRHKFQYKRSTQLKRNRAVKFDDIYTYLM